MYRQYVEKQFSIDDWRAWLQPRLVDGHVPRLVRNILTKMKGGHPLSSSEHNILEAYRLETGHDVDRAD